MSILRGAVLIPRVLIFVCLVGSLAILCLYVASKYITSPLIFSVMTGFVGGLSIFLLDKLVDYRESLLLGARDWIRFTLRSRDNKAYYSGLIGTAKSRIYFLGKTGLRLLTDFADIDAVDVSNKGLLVALQNGVKIRFLLAAESALPSEDRRKIGEVGEMLRKLRERAGPFGANVEVRHYDFAAAYSLFVADETVVFGANFPSKRSRATPSIVSDARGSVAGSYLAFFDEQWEAARQV